MKYIDRIKRNIYRLLAVLAVVTLSQVAMPFAYAASLTSTSISLSDSRISQTSQYTFTGTTWSTGQTIGCIELDLGTAVDGSGSPSGLSTASSTFVSQTITGSGTWTIDNTQSASHKLRITNATPVVPQAGAQTVVFGAVTNGSVANTTYYGVLTTYTTNSCATPSDTATDTFVYTNGQSVSLTVDPSLSFSIAGSASTCNSSPATTVTATSTTVPFGTVTTSTDGIATHDITVSTNANSGYTVFTRYIASPTSGGNTIDDTTGTNASPAAFSAGEAFGYTTNDSTLTATGDGANRFTNSAPEYAKFTTSNAEVAYSATAVSAEVTCVGYAVGIAGTTQAGTYTNTVIFTATPIY